MLSVYYIGLNQLNEDLSDLKVRQALAYGIDKAKIVATVYGESGYVQDSIFPSNHWTYSDDVTKYPYDPAKAKSHESVKDRQLPDAGRTPRGKDSQRGCHYGGVQPFDDRYLRRTF